MAEIEQQPIRLLSQKSGESCDGTMRVQRFSEQECKLRAVKTLLLFWLIAAVCILIPIAHFILVPGFLIGGVVAASRNWKRTAEGLEADGECPVCHNAITIDLEKSAELPQWRSCPHCSESLELQSR